jgi:RHS repeat-associated protein
LIDTTIIYSYNETNRLLTANQIAFGYDNNGNTKSKTGYQFAYDDMDNLISVAGKFNARYVYDGAGNRRQATRNDIVTKYVLDILGIGNVLAETDGGGTPVNYYVYGLGLISRIKPDNTTHFYLHDYRGSTIAMVDASGYANITHKYQYDEFGHILQLEEADHNPFRYVGKFGVMYEDNDLQFMRARYYDPSIGRFISEDPVWSTNLYPYADNNPISLFDPDGRNAKYVDKALNFASYALPFIEKAPISSVIPYVQIARTANNKNLSNDQKAKKIMKTYGIAVAAATAAAIVSVAGAPVILVAVTAVSVSTGLGYVTRKY